MPHFISCITDPKNRPTYDINKPLIALISKQNLVIIVEKWIHRKHKASAIMRIYQEIIIDNTKQLSRGIISQAKYSAIQTWFI